ncbi:hypothetical protein A1507_01135 [Methylomonas koyamae]|uniref:Uncharacterized protein n=1 Tax=Methylomonas koyamae TaxID=702114 RepID=A0A177N9W0_9GAMM|nr:hypothetical protein [Methylomonas koyamae]OAI14836.1 hypothetical protein A1507_01135 [Methylomonas koyamae]WNB76631.1 hypothetical protein RI210_03370 [Methylomonas koyamae]
MDAAETAVGSQVELTRLHATTCLLMTQFINGRHCPKLSQQIVSQLGHLLSHPQLDTRPDSRELYQQLLMHWQGVTQQLIAHRQQQRPTAAYH